MERRRSCTGNYCPGKDGRGAVSRRWTDLRLGVPGGAVAVIVGALSVGNPALAGFIDGAEFGADFDLSWDDGSPGLDLFGLPTLNGNRIDFLQIGERAFEATSLNGEGIAFVPATITITVIPHDDSIVDDALLTERGDYLLVSPDSDSVFANVTGELQLFDPTSGPGPDNPFVDDILPTGGFDVVFPTVGDIVGTPDWSAEAASEGFSTTNAFSLTIQNLLAVQTSQSGELAFVEKKFLSVAFDVRPVPLPPAAWLFGSALAALTIVGRRNFMR